MEQEQSCRIRRSHRWYFYAGLVLLIVALLAGGFLAFLTVTEYRPQPREDALTGGCAAGSVPEDGRLRILSFNIGYGGLDASEDFLMDGGSGVGAENRDTVEGNLDGIRQILTDAEADAYLLQEVDLDSSRTFHINELEVFRQALPDHGWYFAPNYRCPFVPYPLQHPIGSIHSGLTTYTRFPVTQAQRISLPVPFSWPIRTANLKRCLLTTRIPVEQTGKELVLVNLHLEAYDNGEGKIAQTEQLLGLLQEEYGKGNYVIAGGDFNQIFPGSTHEIKSTSHWIPGFLEPLPRELEGWQYAFDDSVPTCRLLNQPYDPESPLNQHYLLDGFILSPNVALESVQTLDCGFAYSDHNPVLLEAVLLP